MLLPLLVILAARAAHAAAEPPAPAPNVTLTIAEEAPHRWRMRVENAGTVPVRVEADGRLLSFEVSAPGAKKPIRCALPADMRPLHLGTRTLVIPPQRAYVEALDPRLYCFGEKEAAALVPGALVVAHLGWPPARGRRRPVGPFEVEPIDAAAERVSPLKELVSAPLAITASPSAEPAAPSRAPAQTPPAEAPPVTISTSPRVDVERGADTTVTVTVTNRAGRPLTLLLRPETLAFDVLGPQGPVRCSGVRSVDPPIRELFTTIAAHGRVSLPVLLDGFCPDKTFEEPGVYIVRATLDTRRASGSSIGLPTFDDVVTAGGESVVRVRVKRGAPLPPRPALE